MDASAYFHLLQHRELPVIVDDERVGAALRQRGFRTLPFSACDLSAPGHPAVLVVLTDLARCDALREQWESLRGAVCHLSLAKFSADEQTLRHALDLLLAAPVATALQLRQQTYDALLSCERVEILTPGATLRCHLGAELEIPSPDDALREAWLHSVAEFLDASLVNLEGERSSFWLEGECAFDGLIHLCNEEAQQRDFTPLLDELRLAAARGGNRVVFRDNAVTRLVLGDKDWTQRLLSAYQGHERGAAPTELGFGCVDFPLPLDFTLNTVLHKSARGAYIGLGMGYILPHIDLIAAAATCRFVPGDA